MLMRAPPQQEQQPSKNGVSRSMALQLLPMSHLMMIDTAEQACTELLTPQLVVGAAVATISPQLNSPGTQLGGQSVRDCIERQ